ncbi:MAG: hypothetical protein EXR01_07540 [Acetobacteraceae bacterium]|nr:hypothetical protein [Acetobacteraceae bacterium]MSP30758.1 hypothetical protein [Acetobacteraceae bacterium]
MKRWIILFVVAGLSMAAGPVRRGGEEALPVPPIPQDLVSSEAAPVPNSSMFAPLDLRTPRGPELSPALMVPKYTYQGEGFLYGSTVQSEQNRKARPAAGFNLKFPLQ